MLHARRRIGRCELALIEGEQQFEAGLLIAVRHDAVGVGDTGPLAQADQAVGVARDLRGWAGRKIGRALRTRKLAEDAIAEDVLPGQIELEQAAHAEVRAFGWQRQVRGQRLRRILDQRGIGQRAGVDPLIPGSSRRGSLNPVVRWSRLRQNRAGGQSPGAEPEIGILGHAVAQQVVHVLEVETAPLVEVRILGSRQRRRRGARGSEAGNPGLEQRRERDGAGQRVQRLPGGEEAGNAGVGCGNGGNGRVEVRGEAGAGVAARSNADVDGDGRKDQARVGGQRIGPRGAVRVGTLDGLRGGVEIRGDGVQIAARSDVARGNLVASARHRHRTAERRGGVHLNQDADLGVVGGGQRGKRVGRSGKPRLDGHLDGLGNEGGIAQVERLIGRNGVHVLRDALAGGNRFARRLRRVDFEEREHGHLSHIAVGEDALG